MSLVVPQQSTTDPTKKKKFNGLRRTADGMLYLTSIDPNIEADAIVVSNYYEEGKSDLVPKDETDYVNERLELFNTQYFTGDGSSLTFTLNATDISTNQLVVYIDSVRKTVFTDYTVSGTTLTFIIKPSSNASIVVAQNKKRYKNNDSDKYQQFKYSDNSSTTYLINSSSGDLVERTNNSVSRTAESSDDFDTFESTTASLNSTTWQSAV
tara:strand:- start:341 stop:970 length:630 start_codon:yes stop_codon:yes gene_type:complete